MSLPSEWNNRLIRIGDIIAVIVFGTILTLGVVYYVKWHKSEPTVILNGVPA